MAISFAKVPGAGSSAPAQTEEPAKPANAEVVDEKNPQAGSTAIAPRQSYSPGFSTGTEDDDLPDEGGGKVRYPYLNLVQPSSKAPMKAVAAEGNFVLAKSLKIPAPCRAVVIGFGRTFYREKVKYNSDEVSRTAYSLEEVAKYGGTPTWNLSIENGRKNGGSTKPWFAPCIKVALLIEQPAGTDEAFFPEVVDSKAYAVALFEAKSTAYDSFYVELNSKKRTTNLFKEGWASRFIEITTDRGDKEDSSFKPVPVVKEVAPARFVEIAKQVAASLGS